MRNSHGRDCGFPWGHYGRESVLSRQLRRDASARGTLAHRARAPAPRLRGPGAETVHHGDTAATQARTTPCRTRADRHRTPDRAAQSRLVRRGQPCLGRLSPGRRSRQQSLRVQQQHRHQCALRLVRARSRPTTLHGHRSHGRDLGFGRQPALLVAVVQCRCMQADITRRFVRLLERPQHVMHGHVAGHRDRRHRLVPHVLDDTAGLERRCESGEYSLRRRRAHRLAPAVDRRSRVLRVQADGEQRQDEWVRLVQRLYDARMHPALEPERRAVGRSA